MSPSSSSWLMRRLESHPVSLWGTFVLITLASIFAAAGALNPEALPSYASSRREVIGMALMLITLPAYFVAAIVERFVDQLLSS